MNRSIYRNARLLIASLVASFVFALPALGYQNEMGGPPPEIRSHIDAFVKALNSGSFDAWEKMAQEHFSPGELKRHSAEARKEIFNNLRRDFGTVSVGQVEGPDLPIRLHIKGSSGASGIIELGLEPDARSRIDSIGLKMGGGGEGKTHPPIEPPPVNGKMSNEQLSSVLDGYFGKLAASAMFSGNVLVAKDGKAIYEKSYGFVDRANAIPNNSGTCFNLGSINKTFTKTAIEQLISRGKLSLTDTVGKLLPDYPQEMTRSATVEQLLQHSGGAADFFGEEFSRAAKDRFRSNADYYKFVSNLKPLFAPGSRKQYCNGCYIVLGAIVERVSGMPYEKYVEENIFKPAGMPTAGPLQSDGITPNVAIGYTQMDGDRQLRSNVLKHGASGSAAGGGYATARDLLQYAEALRHGSIPDVGASNGIGIAGGAPGINSFMEQKGPWTVIVLTNFDPPVGEETGSSLARALSR